MEGISGYCPMIDSKNSTGRKIVDLVIQEIESNNLAKMNLIWLEATGCAGNIISLMNAQNPDVLYLLKKMTNLKYNNSLMSAQGQEAFQIFLDTLDTEFILVVEGAVATKDNGLYTIVARYNGNLVTAMEAVMMASEKAKYVLSAGTCASYGGVSAAGVNPSGSISVPELLGDKVIQVPGCPVHPDWVIGTIANLIYFGMPELDERRRPVMFYQFTVHDQCERRSYFENGIFAEKLGDPECMYRIGCRGPVTRADCPVRQWNGYVNWPVKDNTPCIGCTGERFPDGMEPFINYF